ncbi:methyltransferase-like protein 27 [Hetaerina americana]|uniref:methyltransferase-like protein 27 n=1 Tax=Hetaerina americana TaxID=62018 RepID=UPI003A7F537A
MRVLCPLGGMPHEKPQVKAATESSPTPSPRVFPTSTPGRAVDEGGDCDFGGRWDVPEHTVRAYDEWAERYDVDINASNYNGAISACKAITDYYPLSRRNAVRILDVGAGTGMIGSYLKKNYFRNIDALDPSQKMLDKLKEKNIYGTIWNDYIGYHQTEIPNGHYDCAVTSGAFTDGHIPVSSIYEMVRIVKSDGIICVVIREENLTNSQEYCKLEPTFHELERDGDICQVSRRVFHGYWYRSKGVCYIYKVI